MFAESVYLTTTPGKVVVRRGAKAGRGATNEVPAFEVMEKGPKRLYLVYMHSIAVYIYIFSMHSPLICTIWVARNYLY